MYTLANRIERYCGINGTITENFNNVKRTPRFLKLQHKKTSIWMQDVQWNHPPLAPPTIGDIECQHTIN